MSVFKESRRYGAMNLIHPGSVKIEKKSVTQISYLNSITKWAQEGFPTFVLDGKRSAAFACTTCSKSLLEWLIMPFDVFGILYEPGLFIHPKGVDSGFLLVSSGDFIKSFSPLVVPNTIGVYSFWDNYMSFDNPPIEQMLEEYLDCITEDDDFSIHNETISEPEGRLRLLQRRLVVGLCLSLDRIQAVPNFQDVKRQVHLSKEKQKLPGYIEYKFTKPVDIDIRKEVREYSKSGGGALLVRTLVRGYWRLAACGKDRMERRPVHVMPYWRGPIDAPIALQCPKNDDNLPAAGPWENLCHE